MRIYRNILTVFLLASAVFLLTTTSVEAADTTADDSVNNGLNATRLPAGPYWISPLVGVIVFDDIAPDNNLQYSRTTDGGVTWDTAVDITADSDDIWTSAWFDRETPEFADGNLVHVWWMRAADGVLKYRTIDIANDTLGTERTVATVTSGETAFNSGSSLSGTRVRNGDLMVVGRNNVTISDTNFAYISDDDGATWGSITAPTEGNQDFCLMYPANTADTADATCIFWDLSVDEVSAKMWDDSAGTWTETSVSTSINLDSSSGTNVYNYIDGAVRHSDGFIVIATWNAVPAAGADLLTFTVNPNSIASPGVATGADVLTDTGESGLTAVVINQQNDDVYVAYALGNTTFNDTVDIKYKVSDDDLATFEAQSDYSETTEDIKSVSGGRTISNSGGRIQWAFFDDDDNDLLVNLVNDIEIAEDDGTDPGVPATGTSVVKTILRAFSTFRAGVTFR